MNPWLELKIFVSHLLLLQHLYGLPLPLLVLHHTVVNVTGLTHFQLLWFHFHLIALFVTVRLLTLVLTDWRLQILLIRRASLTAQTNVVPRFRLLKFEVFLQLIEWFVPFAPVLNIELHPSDKALHLLLRFLLLIRQFLAHFMDASVFTIALRRFKVGSSMLFMLGWLLEYRGLRMLKAVCSRGQRLQVLFLRRREAPLLHGLVLRVVNVLELIRDVRIMETRMVAP